MDDYSKINSINEEIIKAGLKFLERCNGIRSQTEVYRDCQMQGSVSSDHLANGSFCGRVHCRCFHFQKRNAVCEEQLLERDGLLNLLKEHILQMKLQAICLR